MRVLVVSLASTAGWIVNEEELCGALRRQGIDHKTVRVRLGAERHLRRTAIWPLVDAIEAVGARRALADGLRDEAADAVVLLSTTASLLAPVGRLRARGARVAVRVDCPSAISRPGPQNAAQRLLERRRLEQADVVLATGPRSAELLAPLAERIAVLPVPVRTAKDDDQPLFEGRDVVVYAADPVNKGLDLVCRAWWSLGERTAGRRLHVTGVAPERGRRLLLREGIAEPPGLRWQGAVSRERQLELVQNAAAYASASQWEGTGIAQLEALAAGVPLVTTFSFGAYEAHPIARRLAPELVTATRDATALARCLAAALEMPAERRREYAAAAAAAVEPFTQEAADHALAEAVLPALRGGPTG